MWRSRVLSSEAIQAVQSVKLAKSADKLEEMLKNKLSRLLKADVLDTLNELQRQNEVHLALKVFNFVRDEEWYTPDLSLFNSMIMMLGKNKFIEMAEQLFVHMIKEGLQPDSRTYTELIGAYFRVDLIEKAMEMYELMKISGFCPDKLTMSILIRNLEKAEEKELVVRVKNECANYIDYPEKFLKEIENTNDHKIECIVYPLNGNCTIAIDPVHSNGLPHWGQDSKWNIKYKKISTQVRSKI
ncbi:hypothetical protein KY290_008172 [Solanum tuberosum]|uniref:Pentatricopeptide repeat-containing protein n=1 Tax=Solanum tuberosum TaxID=4113 RepID=A0ABQ7W8Z0_SOLTU|nr:hypothetical protein KY290_008172 [Solanum tuberosum]